MSQDDIEASRAPLLDHLIELRKRLIRAMIAIVIAFIVCFFFAKHIYNILVIPYDWAAGSARRDAASSSTPRRRNISSRR